jgi:hypothetical protein
VAKVGDGPCKLLLPSGKKVEDAGVSELKDACMAMRVEGVDAPAIAPSLPHTRSTCKRFTTAQARRLWPRIWKPKGRSDERAGRTHILS